MLCSDVWGHLIGLFTEKVVLTVSVTVVLQEPTVHTPISSRTQQTLTLNQLIIVTFLKLLKIALFGLEDLYVLSCVVTFV